MPGAKAASTGRTNGPLLQKPSPQSYMTLPYNQCCRLRVKHFSSFPWYSIGKTPLRAVPFNKILRLTRFKGNDGQRGFPRGWGLMRLKYCIKIY